MADSVWLQETEMLYSYVIDTVTSNCKELFLDEGLPEDILLDLKAIWEHHVESSHATENRPIVKRAANKNRGGGGGISQLDGMDSGDEDDEVVALAALATADDDEEGGMDANNDNDRPMDATEEITSEDDELGVEDADALMDTDNILVCQYDKVLRTKNNFKMQLKAGIMKVNEKDYVFHKLTGEADW